jgi:hypothetical protein
MSMLDTSAMRHEDKTPRGSLLAIADNPATTPTAYVSHASQIKIKGMTIGIPMEIGGFAGAWATAVVSQQSRSESPDLLRVE